MAEQRNTHNKPVKKKAIIGGRSIRVLAGDSQCEQEATCEVWSLAKDVLGTPGACDDVVIRRDDPN